MEFLRTADQKIMSRCFSKSGVSALPCDLLLNVATW